MKKLFISLLFVIFFITCVSAVTWDNIAYWTMQNQSGTIFDLTGNGFNMTVSGLCSNDGILGVGLKQNSNCFANHSVKARSLGLGNYSNTISFWIRDYASTAGANKFIIDFGSNESAGFGPKGSVMVKNITSAVEGWGNFFGTNDTELSAENQNISFATWTFYVQVRDGDRVKLYKNGVLQNYVSGFSQNMSPAKNYITVFKRGASFLNSSLSEVGVWNRNLSVSEILELYNGGIGLPFGSSSVTLDSPANNSYAASSTITFQSSASVFNQNFTNATLFVWYQNGTVFNMTLNNVTGQTNTTTWDIPNFATLGAYRWNAFWCGINVTTSTCISAPSNYTINFGVQENGTFYNAITYQGQQETFITNITIPTGLSFSSTLIWNNTEYATTPTGSGTQYMLMRNITIPAISGNITWFWKIDFSTGFEQNLTSHSQEVRTVNIDDCSSFTSQILNFTLFDEDARTTRINGTIEVLVNLWNNQRTALSGTFNKSYSVTELTTARVCLQNINSTFSMDYETKYYGNTILYSIEYKFAQGLAVTNSTSVQNVNLYSLLDARSTAFTISLQSPELSNIQGAVIDVQRQYIPINQFISVESPITNNIGEAIAHLVHNEVYYNFVVTLNGTLLGTFNNYLVQCQNFVTGECRITLNLIQSVPDIPDFQTFGNITSAFTWQPSARNLFFSFISADGLEHNVSWNVLKLDNWGNTTICTTSAVASTGTFQCTIPIIYGNSSIQAQIYADGQYLGSNIFSLQPSQDSIFGGTRVVLAILMYSTLTLMMIASPATLIIGAMLGMTFAGVFHLVDGGSLLGNASIFMWFIIAGGVILFYMRNKT